jgi:hypothetical protein
MQMNRTGLLKPDDDLKAGRRGASKLVIGILETLLIAGEREKRGLCEAYGSTRLRRDDAPGRMWQFCPV